MSVPYTRTQTTLTVISNFRPVVIPSSHPNFKVLCDLVTKASTMDADVVPLLDIPAAIASFTGDEIKVVGNKLFYRGVEVKDNLAQIIISFVKSGDPEAALPFQRFLANCRANPDPKLVDTIYDWAVKGNMPITPEGCLIAWKIVGPDFKSIHSGKRGRLDHTPGNFVTEPREECDPNRNQTCSTGIHFASMEYIEKGGYAGGLSTYDSNKIVAVVINPEDITAIPTDYNLSKGRCCKLFVAGEVPKPQVRDFYASSGRVYGGWSRQPVAPVAPVKPTRAMRTWTNALQPGDVVRLRDGSEATVKADNASNIVGLLNTDRRLITSVFTSNGRGYHSESESYDLATDVIDVIRRGKRTPRNTAGVAVGQTWAQRGGTQVTIASISRGGTYSVTDTTGNVYTASGRYNSDATVSSFDLVRLVKDVA